jgi:hypothetical protein
MAEPAQVLEDPARLLLLVYRPEGGHALLNQVKELFGNRPSVDVHVIGELDPALERLKAASHAVIVFGISSKEQLPNLIRLLSEGERLANLGHFKCSGFLSPALTHPKVIDYLHSQFSAEILQNHITEKTFRHKVSQTVSVVTAAYSMAPIHRTSASAGEVLWQEPMLMEEDCWIVRRTRDLQFRQTIWSLTLLGPPPIVGEWVAEPSLDAGGLEAWAFKVNDDHLAFQPVPGRWIFWGKPPVFSFDTLMWLMISAAPRLVFRPSQGADYVRIETSELNIKVARNGSRSHYYRAQIQQLLLAERRFSALIAVKKPDFEIQLETLSKGKLLEIDIEQEGGSGRDFRDRKPEQAAEDPDFPGLESPDGAGLDVRQQSYDQVLTHMGFSLTLELPSGAKAEARMLDLFETELTVEVAAESRLRKDHRMTCRFVIDQPKNKLEIVSPGVVTEIEGVEDGLAVVCIEIEPIPQQNMAILLKLFSDRQQSIADFMDSAKGR